MIDVKSIDDFKKYKSMEGYFIITDSANGLKVHSTKCRTLDVSNFKEKVLSNETTNGKYLFTDDLLEAVEYPKVKKCDVCRREM